MKFQFWYYLTAMELQQAQREGNINPFKDEAQIAVFKDPVRTVL